MRQGLFLSGEELLRDVRRRNTGFFSPFHVDRSGASQEAPDINLVPLRDEGGLKQDDEDQAGKQWLDSNSVLEFGQLGFSDGVGLCVWRDMWERYDLAKLSEQYSPLGLTSFNWNILVGGSLAAESQCWLNNCDYEQLMVKLEKKRLSK